MRRPPLPSQRLPPLPHTMPRPTPAQMRMYMVSSGAEALISELVEQLVIRQPSDPASFLSELLATPGPRTSGGAVVATASADHEWSMVKWLGA